MARHTNKRRGKSRRRQTRQRRRSQRGGGIFWDSTAEKLEKNNLQIKALQAENNQLQQENSTETSTNSGISLDSLTNMFKPNPNPPPVPTPVPTPVNPNNPPVTPVNSTIRGGRRRRRRSQRK